MKILKFISIVTTSMLIYGIGLVSPLTPSEGLPSLLEIVTFFIIPLVILGYGIISTEKKTFRVFLWIEFSFILSTGICLFLLM